MLRARRNCARAGGRGHGGRSCAARGPGRHGAARRARLKRTRGRRQALALALFLVLAGVLHFVAPSGYDATVPGWLPPSARFWTIASGIAELVVAAVIAHPRTRRIGGLLAIALFVAVFPANVKMAIDWADRSTGEFLIALARLPLQIPLVWWGYRVYRNATTVEPAREPV